jgi:hypothetical protein
MVGAKYAAKGGCESAAMGTATGGALKLGEGGCSSSELAPRPHRANNPQARRAEDERPRGGGGPPERDARLQFHTAPPRNREELPASMRLPRKLILGLLRKRPKHPGVALVNRQN